MESTSSVQQRLPDVVHWRSHMLFNGALVQEALAFSKPAANYPESMGHTLFPADHHLKQKVSIGMSWIRDLGH